MAENKTKPTEVSVDCFLDGVTDKVKREDSKTLIEMMKSITGEPPKMWGPTMIGFGTYHYVYATGHESDIFLAGFSPRKSALSIYLMCGCADLFAETLVRLGKAKASKGCLYIKKLSDVDLEVLREMIEISVSETQRRSQPEPTSKAVAKPTAKAESKAKSAPTPASSSMSTSKPKRKSIAEVAGEWQSKKVKKR